MLVLNAQRDSPQAQAMYDHKLKKSARLLGSIFRSIFALLTTGNTNSKNLVVHKLFDNEKKYFQLLADSVTVSMNLPQWRDRNICAKFMSVARVAIERCAQMIAMGVNTDMKRSFLEAGLIVSRIWTKLLQDGSKPKDLRDPLLLQATLTVSQYLSFLLHVGGLLLPNDHAKKVEDGEMQVKWFALEFITNSLLPERVWSPLISILSRSVMACQNKSSLVSDAVFSMFKLFVASISNIFELGLLMCPRQRFSILEKVSEYEITEQYKLPESVLQQILSRIPLFAEYDKSCNELAKMGMVSQNRTSFTAPNNEAILAVSWVCRGSPISRSCKLAELNQTSIKLSGDKGKNIVIIEKKDLLVVTRKRLAILRREQPLSLADYAASGWETIISIDFSCILRIVAGLTGDQIHISHKKFSPSDIVQVVTSSMRNAHTGTVLHVDENTSKYEIRVDLGKPIKCKLCDETFSTYSNLQDHLDFIHAKPMLEMKLHERFEFRPDGPFVQMSLHQHTLQPIHQESFSPDILHICFPSIEAASHIIKVMSQAVELVTQCEVQVERDTCSAMSIRHLIRDHVLEKESNLEHRKTGNRVPLPRHLNVEPLVSTVKLFNPDNKGEFMGLAVLILTDTHFFICDENLESWSLPHYWRSDAKATARRNKLAFEAGLVNAEAKNAQQKANLGFNADRHATEIQCHERLEAYKKHIQTAIDIQKRICQDRRSQFSKCASSVFTPRKVLASHRIAVSSQHKSESNRKEADTFCVHTLQYLVEFAAAESKPVFYVGFSALDKKSPELHLNSQSDKFTLKSVAKFRYMIQVETFTHLMKWQRALGPWINKLTTPVKNSRFHDE